MIEDGVDRKSLDYRAGWTEGLLALSRFIHITGARCKRGEVAGLELSLRLVHLMVDEMKAEMAGHDTSNSSQTDQPASDDTGPPAI